VSIWNWRRWELGFWAMLAFQLGLALFASLAYSVRNGDFIGAPIAGAPFSVAFGVGISEMACRRLGAVWPKRVMRSTRTYVFVLALVLFLVHFAATTRAGEAMLGLLLVIGTSLVAVPFLPMFMFSFFGSHAWYKVPAIVALGGLSVAPIALTILYATTDEQIDRPRHAEPRTASRV
jgi:hypothetical protein